MQPVNSLIIIFYFRSFYIIFIFIFSGIIHTFRVLFSIISRKYIFPRSKIKNPSVISIKIISNRFFYYINRILLVLFLTLASWQTLYIYLFFGIGIKFLVLLSYKDFAAFQILDKQNIYIIDYIPFNFFRVYFYQFRWGLRGLIILVVRLRKPDYFGPELKKRTL